MVLTVYLSESYVLNRTQYVEIGNVKSETSQSVIDKL